MKKMGKSLFFIIHGFSPDSVFSRNYLFIPGCVQPSSFKLENFQIFSSGFKTLVKCSKTFYFTDTCIPIMHMPGKDSGSKSQ